MRYFEATCLAVVTAVFCWLLVGVHALVLHADADLRATQTDYQRVAQELVGTMAPLRATLKSSRDSSDQVAKNSAAATATLEADLVKLGTSVDNLNRMITAITADADQVTQHSDNSFAQLDATMKSLEPGIDQLNKSAAELPAILADLKSTSAQGVLISENTANTTHSIDLAAHDIQQFVHRETTPVRGTLNVIKGFLATFAGPLAQVATAAK